MFNLEIEMLALISNLSVSIINFGFLCTSGVENQSDGRYHPTAFFVPHVELKGICLLSSIF